MKISELFGTDWVSRNPENPEIPELLGKLARIRGYDHSGVMSTIVSDWEPTLHHLGVQRSDPGATERDFPSIYEFPEIPKIPKIFPKFPKNFHEISEMQENKCDFADTSTLRSCRQLFMLETDSASSGLIRECSGAHMKQQNWVLHPFPKFPKISRNSGKSC